MEVEAYRRGNATRFRLSPKLGSRLGRVSMEDFVGLVSQK